MRKKAFALCGLGICMLILYFVPIPVFTKYNKDNVKTEFYMQILGGMLVIEEDKENSPNIYDNYSYYVGLDSKHNMYVRYGDGVNMYDYLNETENGKKCYSGFKDFIPYPSSETTYKLSLYEYNKILGNIKKISRIYEGSENSDATYTFEYMYYKFFVYKGKYYNPVQAMADCNERVERAYSAVEKVLYSHIGISEYPQDDMKYDDNKILKRNRERLEQWKKQSDEPYPYRSRRMAEVWRKEREENSSVSGQ